MVHIVQKNLIDKKEITMSRISTFTHPVTDVYTTLHIRDMEYKEYGLFFYADSELEAYQLAHMYNHPLHEHCGSDVGFCKTQERWKVTLYNEKAHGLGYKRAKEPLVKKVSNVD
jgi:hypothetical protein